MRLRKPFWAEERGTPADAALPSVLHASGSALDPARTALGFAQPGGDNESKRIGYQARFEPVILGDTVHDWSR
ncbi:hypothetical protein GCM10011358_09770 [Sinisalibacter lacisalsi]|uniref:Uncharacterized protein n=1 Tax=Sinisalibacter lacisalsi TaxID=1526570 RepID=A0ABQ1QJG9_9RHOB|nr:hypothetical protein GCM10011358_09770 [Sinisalibacter lacisalsi]